MRYHLAIEEELLVDKVKQMEVKLDDYDAIITTLKDEFIPKDQSDDSSQDESSDDSSPNTDSSPNGEESNDDSTDSKEDTDDNGTDDSDTDTPETDNTESGDFDKLSGSLDKGPPKDDTKESTKDTTDAEKNDKSNSPVDKKSDKDSSPSNDVSKDTSKEDSKEDSKDDHKDTGKKDTDTPKKTSNPSTSDKDNSKDNPKADDKDSVKDTTKDKNKDAGKTDDKNKDEKNSEAKESIWNEISLEHQVLMDEVQAFALNQSLALEDISFNRYSPSGVNRMPSLTGLFNTINSAVNLVSNVAVKTYNVASFIAGKLQPIVSKLFDISVKVSKTLHNHAVEYLKSYQRYKGKIADARKTLSTIKDKQVDTSEVLKNHHIQKTLKIGKSLAIAKNIDQLSGNISSIYRDIEINIGNTVVHIDELVQKVLKDIEVDEVHIPVAHISSMSKGPIPGISASDEYNYYHLPIIYPGDRMISMQLSKNNSINRIIHNKIVLAYSQDSAKLSSELRYGTIDELHEILDSLDRLCDVCINNKSVYTGISSKYNKLTESLGKYKNGLKSNGDHIQSKNVNLDGIFYSVEYIDMFYIRFMVELDRYMVEILTTSLEYVLMNLKRMK